jgi:hypothetical protein
MPIDDYADTVREGALIKDDGTSLVLDDPRHASERLNGIVGCASPQTGCTHGNPDVFADVIRKPHSWPPPSCPSPDATVRTLAAIVFGYHHLESASAAKPQAKTSSNTRTKADRLFFFIAAEWTV